MGYHWKKLNLLLFMGQNYHISCTLFCTCPAIFPRKCTLWLIYHTCMRIVISGETKSKPGCPGFSHQALCKMGGFLDLRPWKLEGNMISNLIENLGKPNDTASLLSFYKLSLETSRVLRFSLVSYQASYQVSCRFPWTQVQETSHFT